MNKLAEVCVRRPIFTTMMILSLLVVGLFSYLKLGVDLFPKIDFPTVVITTTLRGASPEEMETSITKPIEEVVNTISGLDEMRSVSGEGFSQVIAQFVLERDIDQAAQDVRDKVATIVSGFPEGTDPPVIEKFDPDSAPIMVIAVSGPRDLREMTEIADKKVKQALETVKDVGSITIVGGRKREIQVYLDKEKLIANRLTIQQVKAALSAQNLELPGGRIDEGRRELMVRTVGRLTSPRDFNDLVVTSVNGMPIKVSDLGYVEDGVEEPRDLGRVDGRPAVLLYVRKQSGTNTVAVVDRVKGRLEQVIGTLPPDIKAEVIRDRSDFIRKLIETIQEHMILGGILASLVILLFIRRFRLALIGSISIPTSIIATFILIRAYDFTLNIMTMLALTLAIGIVIDDAIVVLENIFRHVEEKGTPPGQAAVEATREISLAVMATTISLVVIFLPLAFMGGLVGRFQHQFGMTMAFAIMISLFVAFTMIPMLCSRYIRANPGRVAHTSKESRFYSIIERSYIASLKWALRHRWLVVILALGVIASSYPLVMVVGKDVLPQDDQSEFDIWVTTPEGSTLKTTDAIVAQIEEEVRRLPGVKHVVTSIGQLQGDVTEAEIYIRLVDLKERDVSQSQLMRRAREILKQFPGLRTSVQEVSAIRGGGFRQTPINLNIRGPELEELERLSERVMTKMREIPGLVDVDTTLASRKPEVRVIIDRDKAGDLGVRVADIASSLNTLVAGEEVTKYKEGDEQYEVRLRVRGLDRSRPEDILEMSVPSKLGPVKLKNLVEIREEKGPAQIQRQERQRQVALVANLETWKPLGEALNQIRAEVNKMDIPPGYTAGFTGRAKFLKEVVENFSIAFILSIIFMYMVLAAQFESFIHPLIIMTSLPLSVPFALLSIYVTGGTMNIYSILGILLLFGIVKKNSILQIDFTNTLMRQGVGRYEAIIQANRVRLRPILMTTLTLVAAMIPIALGRGSGAASRAALATVVIGGQSLSLFITLLITPVAYTIFDDLRGLPARLLHKPQDGRHRLRVG